MTYFYVNTFLQHIKARETIEFPQRIIPKSCWVRFLPRIIIDIGFFLSLIIDTGSAPRSFCFLFCFYNLFVRITCFFILLKQLFQ